MARRAARIDDNQPEIVAALLAAGAQVVTLSAVGCGCPDLAVYHPRVGMLFVEVKDGSKPSSDRALTPAQKKFHAWWRGPLVIVETVEQALAAVGVR